MQPSQDTQWALLRDASTTFLCLQPHCGPLSVRVHLCGLQLGRPCGHQLLKCPLKVHFGHRLHPLFCMVRAVSMQKEHEKAGR